MCAVTDDNAVAVSDARIAVLSVEPHQVVGVLDEIAPALHSAGLNEMEHQGFGSALIKGVVTSAEKAERLFEDAEECRRGLRTPRRPRRRTRRRRSLLHR